MTKTYTAFRAITITQKQWFSIIQRARRLHSTTFSIEMKLSLIIMHLKILVNVCALLEQVQECQANFHAMIAPWGPSADLQFRVASEPSPLDAGTLGPSYHRPFGLLPHSSSREFGLSVSHSDQSSQCMHSFTCKFLLTNVFL